jgi:hypothetical protein
MFITSKVFAIASILIGCASSPTSGTAPATQGVACNAPNGARCGASGGTQVGHGPAGQDPMMGMGQCPMEVMGTTVRTADVPGAIAVDFVTTGDVAEVRRRVARMAEMHNHRAESGAGPMDGGMMMGGAGGSGTMHGGMTGMMPPSQARVEEFPDGARLVLTPTDPKDLDALREHASMHVMHTAHGGCPMMSTHTAGLAAPSASSHH